MMQSNNWLDDYDEEDERAEQEFKTRRHNLLMKLPYGHPDEGQYEDEED